MSKEVERYTFVCDIENDEYVLASDYDAILAERDRLLAERVLWEPIHYEIHRRAEKQWCLSSQCDFEVTVTYEDYAAIDAALQGAQP